MTKTLGGKILLFTVITGTLAGLLEIGIIAAVIWLSNKDSHLGH
jgi:hypothetical protein